MVQVGQVGELNDSAVAGEGGGRQEPSRHPGWPRPRLRHPREAGKRGRGWIESIGTSLWSDRLFSALFPQTQTQQPHHPRHSK